MPKLTQPQQDLYDRLCREGRLRVRGSTLRVAQALERKGFAQVKTHGTAYVTPGWYWYAVPLTEWVLND